MDHNPSGEEVKKRYEYTYTKRLPLTEEDHAAIRALAETTGKTFYRTGHELIELALKIKRVPLKTEAKA